MIADDQGGDGMDQVYLVGAEKRCGELQHRTSDAARLRLAVEDYKPLVRGCAQDVKVVLTFSSVTRDRGDPGRIHLVRQMTQDQNRVSDDSDALARVIQFSP